MKGDSIDAWFSSRNAEPLIYRTALHLIQRRKGTGIRRRNIHAEEAAITLCHLLRTKRNDEIIMFKKNDIHFNQMAAAQMVAARDHCP